MRISQSLSCSAGFGPAPWLLQREDSSLVLNQSASKRLGRYRRSELYEIANIHRKGFGELA